MFDTSFVLMPPVVSGARHYSSQSYPAALPCKTRGYIPGSAVRNMRILKSFVKPLEIRMSLLRLMLQKRGCLQKQVSPHDLCLHWVNWLTGHRRKSLYGLVAPFRIHSIALRDVEKHKSHKARVDAAARDGLFALSA